MDKGLGVYGKGWLDMVRVLLGMARDGWVW